MQFRILIIRPKPLPWGGKVVKLPVPMGGGGGGSTRTVPAILVISPRPGLGRLSTWRLSHVLIRTTFGPPPSPPTFILALAMAARRQIDLDMNATQTLFFTMTSNNTLNLVMHGS
jgi:hypothetical protein